MRLPSGGIDVFYIDESTDNKNLVMTAISIPFMRRVDGTWTITWEDHFENARAWRRRLKESHTIPPNRELKGGKLISGHNRYRDGRHSLRPTEGADAYFAALRDLTWLPPLAIYTAVGTTASKLYEHTRLEAVLYALLQRMRRTCEAQDRVGMVFFDEGHGEYRKLYRKARVHLPTGSDRGDWGTGRATKSIPLDNFVKDANIKQSNHSWFIQLADIVAYAGLSKVRAEAGQLSEANKALGLGGLYDAIPHGSLNVHASRKDVQGIIRLA